MTRTREAVEKSEIMYVILGEEPLRLISDVTGEPFWAIVAEA